MAHPHLAKIRYVQQQLEKDIGVKVSYQWVLREVERNLPEARRLAGPTNRELNDKLVELIRPANHNK